MHLETVFKVLAGWSVKDFIFFSLSLNVFIETFIQSAIGTKLKRWRSSYQLPVVKDPKRRQFAWFTVVWIQSTMTLDRPIEAILCCRKFKNRRLNYLRFENWSRKLVRFNPGLSDLHVLILKSDRRTEANGRPSMTRRVLGIFQQFHLH